MKSFIYGPVPSRRLGRSLGVDLVPYKICSYNCVYCQLGPTKKTTINRKPYIPADKILDQLDQKLKEGLHADYITLAGSGEPTLNNEIGSLIAGIKQRTEIPVVVLTNGSLFGDIQVRQSVMEADAVLPSLDGYDQRTFEIINRPHPAIQFDTMVKGLIEFRKAYQGHIWLEVFILEGINDTEVDAKHFKYWTDRINPEKIHINTAVRPSAEKNIRQASPQRMAQFCKILGKKAEVIAPFEDIKKHERQIDIEGDILNLLARRPCSLDDISAGLGAHKNEILKYIEPLIKNHQIDRVQKDLVIYYQVKKNKP